MTNSLRNQVLSLYRIILRVGQSWEAKVPEKTEYEQQYIIAEAKNLFRANKSVSDAQEIKQRLREAEARLEIALHYKTPYPRPVNLPPNTLAKKAGQIWGKSNLKRQHISRPIYIRSIDS